MKKEGENLEIFVWMQTSESEEREQFNKNDIIKEEELTYKNN